MKRYFKIFLSLFILHHFSENEIPAKFSLNQNFLNPFNPSTRINYSIPKAENVTLKIYDILGRQIKTLVNEEGPAGNYKVNFDGSNLSRVYIFIKSRLANMLKQKKCYY